MTNPLQNFLLVLTFFSRIPLPAGISGRIGSDAKLADAVAFFPIVGLAVAVLPACIWFLASLCLPATVSAGLAIVVGLIITGALHEDGLADCADGLGATPDREKALKIMRDSRIGTYGALALGSSFLLRWAALSCLAPVSGVLAVLLAHCASRSSMVIAMRFSSYARKEGLGKLASGTVSQTDFALAIAIPFLLALLAGWVSGIAAIAFGMLAAWGVLKYLEHRLGGYTGDGLGAMQQLSEITILIAFAGFWA